MKPQQGLQTLIADGSSLLNFGGFLAMKGISSIHLRGTPIERIKNYALSLLVVCPNIQSINAKLLKGSIHKKAETLLQKEDAVE